MLTRRRLLPLLALATPAMPLRAAPFGPEVQRVEVGSSTSSVLDPQTSQRLRVQTKLVGIKTTVWVDRHGRTDPTMGSLTQHLVENKYDWETSVQTATDLWQITAEDVSEPALMVLRVRATRQHPLVVSLFPGASSASRLDPELGIQVPPSEDAAHEWLGLFRFDPRQKTFIAVQAREAEPVPYRISVLPAARFRR